MPYKALDLLVVRQMGALRSSVNTLPNGGGYSRLKADVGGRHSRGSRHAYRPSRPASQVSCPDRNSGALRVADLQARVPRSSRVSGMTRESGFSVFSSAVGLSSTTRSTGSSPSCTFSQL